MRLEQITAEALKHVDNNRYLLASAVAKRVDQLLNGAKPLVDREVGKTEPTNIALEEIAKGLIKVSLDK
jgi:DNA-directed RNA polymerase subunit omega